MLKFFRQIRKTLLDSGHVSKYFIYAIGEIFLVVIGILIALQVNNWNQTRLDGIEERKIIKSIYEEIDVNLIYIKEILSRTAVHAKSGADLLALTGPNPQDLPQDSLMHYFSSATFLSYFLPNVSAFESLMNGNDLNLIQDDSLKYLFEEYRVLLTQADRSNKDRENFFNDFVRSYNINEIGGNHHVRLNVNRHSMISDLGKPFVGLKKSNFSIDSKQVLSDKKFESLVSVSWSLFYWYNLSIKEIENHIAKMKRHIETHYPIK